ncbi:MAG: hypothetical protein NTY38_33590 [Acidobacteria bacterium]|nr:hypothetical protein [Acidobacteriota bacterium]
MPQVFYILFGFGFTVVVAWSLGKILFDALGVGFKRLEEDALAFVTGSSLLSLLVFLLCSVGVVRKSVFLWTGLAIVGLAIWRGAFRRSRDRFAPLPRKWMVVGVVVGAVFTWMYFVNSMAPEYSPDGSSYHLGLVARYLRAHGFERITTNIYANLSQGMEMLFLWAFAFGRHSAAAMVHFAFLLALPVLVLSHARRIGEAAAGAAAAMFVYVSPVVGIDGTVAYNDVAAAATVFGVFHVLQIWDEERNWKLLVLVGLRRFWRFLTRWDSWCGGAVGGGRPGRLWWWRFARRCWLFRGW